MVNLKDFNILGTKVSTSLNKKDLSLVTGFNSIVQNIEQVCKTQKGELPSDLNFGSEYFSYIFNPVAGKNVLENKIKNNIEYNVKNLKNVEVKISYMDEQKVILNVSYSLVTSLKNQNGNVGLEVPLQ